MKKNLVLQGRYTKCYRVCQGDGRSYIETLYYDPFIDDRDISLVTPKDYEEIGIIKLNESFKAFLKRVGRGYGFGES